MDGKKLGNSKFRTSRYLHLDSPPTPVHRQLCPTVLDIRIIQLDLLGSGRCLQPSTFFWQSSSHEEESLVPRESVGHQCLGKSLC